MSKRSPDRLRVTNPASLAVASIVLLGYLPHSSVVIVPIGKTGPVARMPLPENPERDIDVAAVLARAMTLDMPREIAICVFDESIADSGCPPRRALVAAFRSECEGEGVSIAMAVHIGRERWHEYTLHDETEPEYGCRDALDREVQETLAQLGRAPLSEGPNGNSAIPLRDPQRVEQVRAVRVSPIVLEDPASTWETLLSSQRHANDADIAALAVMLGSGRCRDLILVQAVRDLHAGRISDRVGRALERGVVSRFDEADLDEMCSVIVGLTDDRPHLRRMERVIELFTSTASATEGQTRARALGVVAWAHWVLSAPNIASLFADEARVVDSTITLAGSIDDLIEVGHLPRWYGLTPRGADR